MKRKKIKTEPKLLLFCACIPAEVTDKIWGSTGLSALQRTRNKPGSTRE